MFLRSLVVFCIIFVFGWNFYPEIFNVTDLFVDSKGAPIQKKLEKPRVFNFQGLDSKNYKVTMKHSYKIKARVLSKKEYTNDQPANISRYDLALGWGDMSNVNLLDKLSIGQGRRFYMYRWQGESPISPQKIRIMSANTHIIASNNEVMSELRAISKYDIIYMEGYLVDVAMEGEDGRFWYWSSSETRRDKGDGACEVMYVTKIVNFGS